MIILDSTTRTLKAVLAGAVTTNQLPIVACYVDGNNAANTFVPGTQTTVTNSTTPVTVVSAPVVNGIRQVKIVTIYNADTASAKVTLSYDDNSTLRSLVTVTMSVGDTLIYTDGEGFRVMDSAGEIKVTGGSGSGSSLASGDIWVGNASNVATALAMSGDATLSNAGVITIGAGAVTGSKIASSVALAGSPTTTTQSPGDNSTKLATTAFVTASFAPSASPTFSGTPAAPTAGPGTNTTQIATTAFVQAAVSGVSGGFGNALAIPAPGIYIDPSTGLATTPSGQGFMVPMIIPVPMLLDKVGVQVNTGNSGTVQWGLFRYDSNPAAATQVAGGSGSLASGSSYNTIAASGAPVTISPGAYVLIIAYPASNCPAILTTPLEFGGPLMKFISPYTFTTTPDLTSAWAFGSDVHNYYLHGRLSSGAAW